MPVTVGVPSQRDPAGIWTQLAVLSSPPALESHLARVLAECEGHRDVATAFLAARFASPLARLAVVPVLTRERALDHAPPDLWLRIDGRGLVTGVRVAAAGLTAAAAPRAAAVGTAVDGYRPVVSGLRALGALGARALWGQLADALVAVIGQTLADDTTPQTAAAEADRWLRGADPPLWGRPEFARVMSGGRRRLAWRRGSCCLAYRLTPFGLCSGCPLQSRSAWLAAGSPA